MQKVKETEFIKQLVNTK